MVSNVAVKLEGNILVVVHSANAPSDEEWEIYVQALLNDAPRIAYQLVWSAGGGPNAAQRKRAVEATKTARRSNKVPPTAVMTKSHGIRALVTMFNWFFPDVYTAFGAEDYEGALALLNVPRPARAKYIGLLGELREAVGA